MSEGFRSDLALARSGRNPLEGTDMYHVIYEELGESLDVCFTLEQAAAVALALCRQGFLARVELC